MADYTSRTGILACLAVRGKIGRVGKTGTGSKFRATNLLKTGHASPRNFVARPRFCQRTYFHHGLLVYFPAQNSFLKMRTDTDAR